MKLPVLLAALTLSQAAPVSSQDTVYRLWPEGNPDGWKVEGPEVVTERDGIRRVKNVNTPTLTYYAPGKTDEVLGKGAMIVCPGGGYSILAIDHEGHEIAAFLSGQGMHAFVLKYRLPKKGKDPSHWHVPVQDAQRAVSLARQLATHLGYETGKVGIMGFSAGGHLTAATSNAFHDRAEGEGGSDQRPASRRTYPAAKYEPSSHPDFAALVYPAYLVGDAKGKSLSPEVQVRKGTPPSFLAHTEDDRITALSSLFYYRELKMAAIPSEIHVFAEGGHGYGMRHNDKRIGMWPQLMAGWLRDMFAG